MGLTAVQKVLAQLYTNKNWRESFFTNPQVVGKEWGLNLDEIQSLIQLSRQQVDFFATSLKQKRLGQVRQLLPLTRQSLGRDFNELFFRYGETYSPSGIKKHWQDALHFSIFLEREKKKLLWLVNVIHYERAWLETQELTRRFICYRFDYKIDCLIESLRSELKKPGFDYVSAVASLLLLSKPTFAIWFRLSLQGKWHYLTF